MGYSIFENEIKLREYGRVVQQMVEYAKTLTDPKERNALVHEIVRIMSCLNPSVKDTPDFYEKLWDHLYHIADYELDVDAPFPPPTVNHINARPEKRMAYYKNRAQIRAYGQNVQLMIEEALRTEDPARKRALITVICNVMKVHVKNNDRDSNVEAVVLDHLRTLSKGKLDFRPDEINFYRGNITNSMPGMPPRLPKSSSGGAKKKKKKKAFFK